MDWFFIKKTLLILQQLTVVFDLLGEEKSERCQFHFLQNQLNVENVIFLMKKSVVTFVTKKMRHEMVSCIWFWPSELKKQLCSLPHSKFQTEVWSVFEAMWALKKGLKLLTRNSKVRFWIFILLQHWSSIFWDTVFELLHVIRVCKTTLLVKHK